MYGPKLSGQLVQPKRKVHVTPLRKDFSVYPQSPKPPKCPVPTLSVSRESAHYSTPPPPTARGKQRCLYNSWHSGLIAGTNTKNQAGRKELRIKRRIHST